MEISLTRDADKMICYIYKAFLQQRKDGESKSVARRFENNYFSTDSKLSSWNHSDIRDPLLEIARAGFIKIYIGGDFDLTDNGIIYMEKHFKNGLVEITDFIAKFIP